MAKKVTKTEAAPAAAAPAEAKQPTSKGGDNDVFTRIHKDGKPVDLGKMPPQAIVICNAVEAAGDKGITRAKLIEALSGGVLKTRQPVGRIISYYQKLITQTNGAVAITSGAPAAAPASK